MDFQGLYLEAVQEYESGDYNKAYDIFCHLSIELPTQMEIWKGLAACNQARKNYAEAIMGWGMAAFLDTQDPIPHFHAAECLFAQGNRTEALKAVRVALGLPCTEDFLNQIVQLKEVIDNG